MDYNLLALGLSCIILLYVIYTHREGFVPQNPMEQLAKVMYGLQIPDDCTPIMEDYSKNPTDEKYVMLLNCKSSPEKNLRVKQIAGVFMNNQR